MNDEIALSSVQTALTTGNAAVTQVTDRTIDDTGAGNIYNALPNILGGKDVLVRATTVQPCAADGTNDYECFSRPSDPFWFRTIPYYAAIVYQNKVEEEDRANFKFPPYKSANTVVGATDGSVTLFWFKHEGPEVLRYEVLYWIMIPIDGAAPCDYTAFATNANTVLLNLGTTATSGTAVGPTGDVSAAGTQMSGYLAR